MSALATGLVHSGNQEQKVFDIDDVIPDEEKFDRPLSTGLPKTGNPDNDLYHIMDRIRPTDGTTKSSAEATTLTAKRHNGKQQIGCRLHHMEEKVTVGMVSNGNKTYGSKLTEYEQQRMDVLNAQLENWEWVLGGRQNCQAGSGDPANGAGNHFITRGGSMWITDSSESWAADAPTNIDNAFRTPSTSIATLHVDALDPEEVNNRMTRHTLNTVLGSLWDVTGKAQNFQVVCTRPFKAAVNELIAIDKVIDGLTTIARFNGQIEKKRLGFIVEIYVNETGTFTFQMSIFLPPASDPTPSVEALVINTKHAEVAVRNKPDFYPIDKLDLTEATAVAGTMGLGMRPRFHGKFLRAAS